MALSKIDVANMLTGVAPVANGGTGLSSGFTNGKIGQVLQSSDDTETTISSESFGSISLSQAITPSATSSKVLIMGYVQFFIDNNNQDKGLGLRIRRDSTAIQTSTTHYDAYRKTVPGQDRFADRFPFMYIDSPSSSSQITYSIRISALNNLAVKINHNANYSQIQCWEILA